jgi:hypothetical protein
MSIFPFIVDAIPPPSAVVLLDHALKNQKPGQADMPITAITRAPDPTDPSPATARPTGFATSANISF